MKPRIAKISLVVALVLFFSGFFVLCDCPGWYALAAGFAGITVWLGSGRTHKWATFWMIASLAFTALQAYAKIRTDKSIDEIRQRYQESQPKGTNQIH